MHNDRGIRRLTESLFRYKYKVVERGAAAAALRVVGRSLVGKFCPSYPCCSVGELRPGYET